MIVKKIFNILIEKGNDGFYTSEVVELPGCHTQAKTRQKLIERTKEAISLYLEEKPPKLKKKFLDIQQLEVEV